MARSGSTFLCELLASTGLAGNPDEYFLPPVESRFMKEWGVESFPDYLSRVFEAGTGENGQFGAKVIGFHHIEALATRLKNTYGLPLESAPRVLEMTFPNLKYVWITRRDKLRQAISFIRAWHTDMWFSTSVPTKTIDLTFNPEEIDRRMELMTRDDSRWQNFFDAHGIRPFRVVYEELAGAQEEITMQVLEYLGIPLPQKVDFAPRRLQRQADGLTEEWVRRYQEIKRAKPAGWSRVSEG